ncbi:MAG: AAA family ATPase, partial [Halanaerobiales bacterium]
KELIQKRQELKEQIEKVSNAAENAEREADYEKAARLRYGELHDLQKELEEVIQRIERIENRSNLVREEVTEEDIAEIVASWTDIPVQQLMEDEKDKLKQMENELSRRVVGQDEAITAVSNAIRRSRTGLQDEKRPLGSFIFMGPTGVGKTELARTLAAYLFDDEKSLIRLDMSEYMERHAVAKLIGSPPGYVGFEEGGQLTEKVRRQPYSVILLDEIEKAHPDVFNILLQILDDGILTDSKGNRVDFRNTIIIMTSNLGSEYIQDLKDNVEIQQNVSEALKKHFRPEFINRIDEQLIFHSLSKEDIMNIVDIKLSDLKSKLQERNIRLNISDEAKEELKELGYDPTYGARPLDRVIQKYIKDQLALQLLDIDTKNEQEVQIDFFGDKFTFNFSELN